MSIVSERPALDETLIGVVTENCEASLQNPLRGGETLYARNIRPGRGHAEALDEGDWAFIADKVGAIVHDDGQGEATIQYFTSLSDLEETWERVVELHEADVEATQ